MKIESRACEIVAGALKIQGRVAITDNMETLAKWDSLAHMALVLEVEKEIDRQLSAEEIVSITTVRSIADLLAVADGSAVEPGPAQ